MAEYALYQGDELLIIGTIDEIAKSRGLKKRKYVFDYGTPSYAKKTKNGLKLIKLEDE